MAVQKKKVSILKKKKIYNSIKKKNNFNTYFKRCNFCDNLLYNHTFCSCFFKRLKWWKEIITD